MQKSSKTPGAAQTAREGCKPDGVHSIYYDGSCPLCTVEINHYASRIEAGRLRLIDVSAEHPDLKQDLTAEAAMNRFHVRQPNGELLSGAHAFVEIWRLAPGWTWAARLARIPGVLPLLEVSYRGFLVVRPALSWCATRLGVQAENPRRNRHRKNG